MLHYRSSRGAIAAWRQGGDAYVAATLKDVRDYSIRSRGTNVKIASNFSAGVAVNGSSDGTFSLAGSSVASIPIGVGSSSGALTLAGSGVAAVPIAGNSSGAVVLTGSSAAALPIAGTSDSLLLLSGSATGTVAQDGWGSAGVFTLGGTGQATFAITATSDGSFALGGTGAGAVSISSTSSGSMTLTGSATATVSQPSGGGTADPADVWNFTLPNGKSAQQTLVEVHAMLVDLYKIHGLMAGVPLVVDQTSRVAGDIEQAITEVNNVVSVTRTS